MWNANTYTRLHLNHSPCNTVLGATTFNDYFIKNFDKFTIRLQVLRMASLLTKFQNTRY